MEIEVSHSTKFPVKFYVVVLSSKVMFLSILHFYLHDQFRPVLGHYNPIHMVKA
jgi:hypothetical protein